MAATFTSVTYGSGTAITHYHPDLDMAGLTTDYKYQIWRGGNLQYSWTMIEGDGSGTLTLRAIWEDYATDTLYTWTLMESSDGGDNYSEVDTVSVTIELPTAATNPTPADSGALGSWNNILSWDAGGNTTAYNVLVGGQQLTIWPRFSGPDFTDTTYTLATVNEWFGTNDYDLFDPYNNNTHTWKVYSYNQWLNYAGGDTYITGGDWTFGITPGYVPPPPPYPPERPDDYDPDDYGDDSRATGGGRYKSRIFTIGHKVMYFGDI